MAYDEVLAERVREAIGDSAVPAPSALRAAGAQAHPQPEITEQKMFGGLAFLDRGKMTVGVMGDDLIVRVGPEGKEAALARPGVREFDFTGRPMRGFVVVAGEFLDDDELAGWIEAARTFAASLPAKSR